MAAARYPLAAVRRFRERQRDMAGEQLAVCLRSMAAVEEALARLHAEIDETHAEQTRASGRIFAAGEGGPVAVRGMQREQEEIEYRRQVLRDLKQAVEGRQSELKRARERVREARLALAEAARAVEVLEKHHERWRREQRRQRLRAEQKRRGELATALWLRRTAEEAP